MKALKLLLVIFCLSFLANGNSFGQVMHLQAVVTFDEYDYTPYSPMLGIVSGSYTYNYAIKLSKEGKIVNVQWHVTDCDLHNQKGDKIIVVDTGHDNLGLIWEFWNSPNKGNGYDPRLTYAVEDGWLDDYMPEVLPLEGTYIDMSFKMMIKGEKWDLYAGMVQVHINANGILTADVSKP